MANVFDIIKSVITQNYTPTYGELINESRNENNMYNNAIRNMCTDDEYEEYTMIMAQHRQRLLNENNTQNIPQQRKKNTSPISVSGIGEVTQIC